MDAGGAAGVKDVFISSILVRVLEVIHQRLIEKNGVLRHHTDMLANGVDSKVLHIVSIDKQMAPFGVIESEQQPEDCRFASARLTDQGGGGAWFAVER